MCSRFRLRDHIMRTDNILLYHLQKLQEVGYRAIQIANSTETTVNLTISQTNQTIERIPGRLVEMTYSTNFAPNETRRSYFILTASDATAPNLGTTKGYTILYEGRPVAAEETTTASDILLPPIPVRQVFDSFELIAAPELAQAIAQEAQAAETAEDGGDGGDSDEGNESDGGEDDDGDEEGGPTMAERIIKEGKEMAERIIEDIGVLN